jgi:transcription elongation GreA/GreB family factor
VSRTTHLTSHHPRLMTKPEVLAAIIDELKRGFENLSRAAAQSRESATDPESKNDGKYDTRSTEANYLADGQARQAAEIAEAAAAFEQLKVRKFNPADPIALGALVEIEIMGERDCFFLGPASGGLEISLGEETITVLTPESPLGQNLIGRHAGDQTTTPTTPTARILSVR